MPDVDFAGLRTVAMAAARQPEFGDIERRAAQVRRRQRLATTAATAAAVVLAVAGTGYAVGGLGGAAPDPGGNGEHRGRPRRSPFRPGAPGG
jgi:hypothetical protein